MLFVSTSLTTSPGGWALYIAIRYFLAFANYDSTAGATVALALGISASLCIALLSCAILLSTFRTRLLRQGVPPITLSSTFWTVTYTSLIFFFIPAAANFALVFAWRHSADLQLRPNLRCHVDIDLLWSKTRRVCKTQDVSWGPWVALASVRLAVTLLVVVRHVSHLHESESN